MRLLTPRYHRRAFRTWRRPESLNVAGTRLDQVEHEDVGCVVDRRRGVAQLIQQPSRRAAHDDRQGDEDDVDVLIVDVANQFAERAFQFRIGFGPKAVGAAVIEETLDLEA